MYVVQAFSEVRGRRIRLSEGQSFKLSLITRALSRTVSQTDNIPDFFDLSVSQYYLSLRILEILVSTQVSLLTLYT